jgi:hypothetical protein
VKKLALGGGVAFQWPPLENTIVFLIKGSFLPYLLPLAIFSQCCKKIQRGMRKVRVTIIQIASKKSYKEE